MEEKFLIDTNIIIYFLEGKIPDRQIEKVRKIFENSFIVSTISNIEVLGWHKITHDERIKTEHFLSNAKVIYLDKPIEKNQLNSGGNTILKHPMELSEQPHY